MRRPLARDEVTPSPVAYVSDGAALLQTLFDLIDAAQECVVLQMYLLAGNHELVLLHPRAGAFPWAAALTDRLIAKRQRDPHVELVVILDTQTPDDARRTRGGRGPLSRHRLEAAGVSVLNANLFSTHFDRDRHFPAATRFHAKPTAETPVDEWVAAQQAWQTWHNVEDHRKNLVIDRGTFGAITSHNAIDLAFDWHDNLFLVGAPVAGQLWDECRLALQQALELPQRVDQPTRDRLTALAALPPTPQPASTWAPSAADDTLTALGDARARPALVPAVATLVSSRGIRTELEAAVDACKAGDVVCAASTYFADTRLFGKLWAAAERGAQVRVLIDDCAGLPLPAFESWFVRTFVNLRCTELARRRTMPGFELRVFSSKGPGPMMHLKTVGFLGARTFLIGGQANYTPNTFSGAWLDTVVKVEGEPVVQAFLGQFESLWRLALPLQAPSVFERLRNTVLLTLLRLAEWIGFRP